MQLEKLVLLWSQLKNFLELIKAKDEERMKVVDLVNRRKILEQRRDHLMVIKRNSRLDPVRKEQREIKYERMKQLHQEVNKLGRVLDPSKCEVTIPTMIENKKITLMITVSDINNDLVSDSSDDLRKIL